MDISKGGRGGNTAIININIYSFAGQDSLDISAFVKKQQPPRISKNNHQRGNYANVLSIVQA